MWFPLISVEGIMGWAVLWGKPGIGVGVFTLSFNDLTVPVAGIPITVTRTYDSRDKRQGDFGFGWTLSLSNVRLQKTGVMGANWQGTTKPGFFPTYCVEPINARRITIALPPEYQDGPNDLHEFVPRFDPECQLLIPQQEGTIRFDAQPGTTSTLRPLLNDYVLLNGGFPGPFGLVDYDTLEPFDAELWLLTLHDGRELIVDSKGKLISIRDLNGNYLSIDASGITHSSGKSVVFDRDGLGRITSITDPDGHRLTYAYDARQDLVAVTDRTNATTSFAYIGSHYLHDIIDPRGVRAERREYDADGRLISITDPFGESVLLEHDIPGRTEVVRDRLGNPTTSTYDDRGNVVQIVDALNGITTRTYDGYDNETSITDPLGHTRSRTFDNLRNVLTETDALGHTVTKTYDSLGHLLTRKDARGNTTVFTYDRFGNPQTVTDPLGAQTVATYDGQGNLKSQRDAFNHTIGYTSDAYGNTTSETDPLGNVTAYGIDGNGRQTSVTVTRTLPSGGSEMLTTGRIHDASGRLVETRLPDGTSKQTFYNALEKVDFTRDQLGHETHYTYDNAGRLSTVAYADSTTETTTYDANGRRRTFTDRGNRTTTYDHDALGRLTQVTYADASFVEYHYDAAGRLTETIDENRHSTRYGYDGANRRTSITDARNFTTTFSLDENGNIVGVTNANGQTMSFEYDKADRQTKTIFPDTTFTTTTYDLMGRVIAQTDQRGRTTQFGYDAVGRHVSTTDALNQVTTFTYDELGHQLTVTDANNHTTSFEYDQRGQLVKRILPLAMYETMTFDTAGNLAAKTDFSGFTTTFEYDAVNRLTAKIPDSRRGEATVSFSYFPSGMRQTMTDGHGVTTYMYDQRDRLLNKDSPEGVLSYTWDGHGNVTSISSGNAGGTRVLYTWLDDNRLSQVIDAQAGTFTYAHDGPGNVLGWTYPNGVAAAQTFDVNNRLRSVLYQLSGSPVASYAYGLDATGRRTSVTEGNGRTVGYAADALYRLTSEYIGNDPAGVNGQIRYTFDPVGNRLRRDSTVATVPGQAFAFNANNQVSGESYDLSGNVITDRAGNTYEYTFENRVSTRNGGATTCVYDGDGNRVACTSGGVTTKYLLDDRNPTRLVQVIEQTVNGTVTARTTYGLTVLAESGGNGTTLTLTDGIGSVRVGMVGTTATSAQDFDAYGVVLYTVGPTTAHQFLGELLQEDLGAIGLRERDYVPDEGRFRGRDPELGKRARPASLHGYSYADADPVNGTDRTGRMTALEVMGALTIGGIVAALLIGAAKVAIPANRGTKLYVDKAQFGIDGMCIAINPPYNNHCVPMSADTVWEDVIATVKSHFRPANVIVEQGSAYIRPRVNYRWSPASGGMGGGRLYGSTQAVWGTVFLGAFADAAEEAPFHSTTGLANALANATSHEGLHALIDGKDDNDVPPVGDDGTESADLRVTYINVPSVARQVELMERSRSINPSDRDTLKRRSP